jgi:hypothetical protein
MNSDWLIISGLVFVLAFTMRQVSPLEDQVMTLYRQAARYAVASLQDESDIIRVLHANYAMGYLMALKDIVTDDQFEKFTGVNRVDFERRLASIQDMATKKLLTGREGLDPMLQEAIYASAPGISDM